VTAFADASALVTLYADEPGHDVIAGRDVLVVSALSRVEVPAALWRKQRTGELTAGKARVLVDDFLAAWDDGATNTVDVRDDDRIPAYLPVRASTSVLDAAVRLCGVHGLRAYDAVQLASATAARAADDGIDTFLALDRALTRAAAAEGFTVPERG
jgi:predicted nucleic acid-binding protein